MLQGSCFCGAVSYTVSGSPVLSAFCHCTNCQRLSGESRTPSLTMNPELTPEPCAFISLHRILPTIFPPKGCPFVHTIHFPESAFAWTHSATSQAESGAAEASRTTTAPESSLDSFVVPSKPWKTRWRCRSCGACVSSANSKTGNRSVWGAQLARDGEGKIIGWDIVKPTDHIFYDTRMLNVKDGLGKWEGYEGSSERLDE